MLSKVLLFIQESIFLCSNRIQPSEKEEQSHLIHLQLQKHAETERPLLFARCHKALPEVKLRIIGEKGDFADKRFVSVGIKRGKDLVEEMQRATALALPSIRHMEGFPMVLIEAMACQTPVIGTNLGGIPEVISDGIDGFIVPPKDSKALALAISKIVADKELATRMGHSGEDESQRKVDLGYTCCLTKRCLHHV